MQRPRECALYPVHEPPAHAAVHGVVRWHGAVYGSSQRLARGTLSRPHRQAQEKRVGGHPALGVRAPAGVHRAAAGYSARRGTGGDAPPALLRPHSF